MQKIDGKRLGFILHREQVEKIEEISERFGVKKSEAVRIILGIGLDTYEVYEGVGVVKLAEITKKVRRALKAKKQPQLF